LGGGRGVSPKVSEKSKKLLVSGRQEEDENVEAGRRQQLAAGRDRRTTADTQYIFLSVKDEFLCAAFSVTII
jgi:hypothetical protein